MEVAEAWTHFPFSRYVLGRYQGAGTWGDHQGGMLSAALSR